MTMKTNEVVNRESFLSQAERRIDEKEIAGFGRIRMRSLRTSEYVAVEGLLTRAMIASRAKKSVEAKKLMLDAKVKLITLCVVDANNEPFLGMGDSEYLENMDYGILSAIEAACGEHCGIEGIDVEEAEKNSETTPGSSSPTD